MTETLLNESDFVDRVPEILRRARQGERFSIVRNGEPPILLLPQPPAAAYGIHGEELIARIGGLRAPGGGFADDVEAARATLLPVLNVSWPD
jgi:antitoxin (DNA-binding transcriptional repressor) of toxin-antitoxin stability system